jgi:hypothetical protein
VIASARISTCQSTGLSWRVLESWRRSLGHGTLTGLLLIGARGWIGLPAVTGRAAGEGGHLPEHQLDRGLLHDLSVVSTAVGGIPEVLPEQFIYCVQPSVGSIQTGLERAVEDVITGYRPDPWEGNIFVSAAYTGLHQTGARDSSDLPAVTGRWGVSILMLSARIGVRFASRYWMVGSEHTDAFSQDWSEVCQSLLDGG